MSADLLVFDKKKAPRDPKDFMQWYLAKAEWDGDRDYSDTRGTSKPLSDFFMELIQEYPPMNGRYAPSQEEVDKDSELESRLTDYTIDDDLIYMGFAWSVADEARRKVETLAYQFDLGFFDMFEIHFDKDTVISVSGKDSKKDTKKSWLSKLFK